jgi:hypothetical protein
MQYFFLGLVLGLVCISLSFVVLTAAVDAANRMGDDDDRLA